MNTRKRGTTPEMQVTSIRLESELKERLREISGEQGYQALIRDILWQFVEQQTISDDKELSQVENGFASLSDKSRRSSDQEVTTMHFHSSRLSMSNIRATFSVIAHKEERCAITGQYIHPQQKIWLGLTDTGELVPLSLYN
ncbi:hypothetical protein H6F93_19395 [Leptolyngbya sp. FACHB-671]|uniref:hypothetical protein n=1 Tax=Leptolyngbya sp. FACHB-671 TaxID=2692812 RepID=UPI0016840352|nr:hypothetical protein [Leptolyngbya sp. FACHB-671]MBD2069661.1 hypothetical protein [Leptolyngbya sp. FACHB-671]